MTGKTGTISVKYPEHPSAYASWAGSRRTDTDWHRTEPGCRKKTEYRRIRPFQSRFFRKFPESRLCFCCPNDLYLFVFFVAFGLRFSLETIDPVEIIGLQKIVEHFGSGAEGQKGFQRRVHSHPVAP